MFEDARDVENFENCVGRVVKRRLLDVRNVAILTTHFHMLVVSLDGRLSAALRDLESAYVRAFNERHDRSGPLVTGPFFSTKLEDDDALHRTVRYIDWNAVQAGLAKHPFEYANGSAQWYALDKGPSWLSRTWVERFVVANSTQRQFSAHAYAEVFLSPQTRDEIECLDWSLRVRLRSRSASRGPWDLTVEKVREWLRQRCAVADGSVPGYAAPCPRIIDEVWARARAHDPEWRSHSLHGNIALWQALRVGLLRNVGCARYTEIAVRIGIAPSSVQALNRSHSRLMSILPEYALRAALLTAEALARRDPSQRDHE